MRIQLASTVSPKIKFDGELCISARVSIISNIIEKKKKLAQLTPPSPTWRLSVQSAPEKPRRIIIGFQTDKENNQETNHALFDNVNVKDVHVNLNQRSYPEVSYNLSFPQKQFSRAYGDVADFRAKYYNLDEICSNCNISPLDYKTLFPLFVFDVSKQSERLKSAITDIHIKVLFNENHPADTQIYALVISDRIFKFQSDGNRLSVIQ